MDLGGHEGAVFVEADPVVGKDGIRLGGLRRVIGREYRDAFAAQRLRAGVELRQGRRLPRTRLLHLVGDGGFRVVIECRRPNHQHRGGTLLKRNLFVTHELRFRTTRCRHRKRAVLPARGFLHRSLETGPNRRDHARARGPSPPW